MRFAGRLTDWHDDKGYGFVVPNGGGERAFVHVKAFERVRRRPSVGDQLTYAIARDDKGRLAAVRVRVAGQAEVVVAKSRGGLRFPRVIIGLLVIAAIGYAGWRGALPVFATLVYGMMSVVSFAMYASDKRAANENTWRTPESTLHGADLFGGWPGGLIAQGVFRHKTSKTSFQILYWLTVVANIGLAAWLLSSH